MLLLGRPDVVVHKLMQDIPDLVFDQGLPILQEIPSAWIDGVAALRRLDRNRWMGEEFRADEDVWGLQ